MNVTSSQGESQKDDDVTGPKTDKVQSSDGLMSCPQENMLPNSGGQSSVMTDKSAGLSSISNNCTITSHAVTTTVTQVNSVTSVTQPLNTVAPIMPTNQIETEMGNAAASGIGGVPPPPSLVPGSQGAPNGPTIIFQNGQLLLVPPSGQVPPPIQSISTDGQSQVDGSRPASTSSNTSSVLPSHNTGSAITTMPSGVPSSIAFNPNQINSSQAPNMPAGPGMRMQGIMGLPGTMSGQMLGNPALGGPQQQIVIGPNGQPMLLQNPQPGMPNAPMFSQSQPSSDVGGIATANQMAGGPATANQNVLNMSTQPAVPNQLPNALILPNGQVRRYFASNVFFLSFV